MRGSDWLQTRRANSYVIFVAQSIVFKYQNISEIKSKGILIFQYYQTASNSIKSFFFVLSFRCTFYEILELLYFGGRIVSTT